MPDAAHHVAPLFADASLARLLEGAEAAGSRAFCRAAMEEYPNGGMRVVECAGGCGLFYGPSDPLNAVKGVGLNGPVSVEEWDRLEKVFAATRSPVVVDLSPLADEAFVGMLAGPGGRGYAIGSFETVLCRRLDSSSDGTPELPEGAMIELVGPERAAVWGRVLDVGFADGGEPMKMAVDISRVRARLPHSVMLLASVDGEPAGGAGMSIHGSAGGVAHMAGAAVLPAFRGRGLQRALTAARLRIARERGCTLAKLDVRAGTVSHRNAVRSGFQVAYTRPQLIRSW
jgi:ribosomal protein S18 acetylase RimI-like enzyme